MSTASASPAEPVLVWDAPVRVFHGLLVLCFAGAYLSAESERWRLLHVTLGYTLAALVVFRIVWGVVGTRYARFADFVRGPSAVVRYLTFLIQGPRGEPPVTHHLGHNPAGALAIIGLLGLAVGVAATGWATYHDVGGELLGEAHEAIASLMLALVGLHVAAVLFSSWRHGENLIGAMISGRKPGQPQQAIRRAWWPVAVLMLAMVLGYWWLQWQGAPTGGMAAAGPAAASSPVAEPGRQRNEDGDHDKD